MSTRRWPVIFLLAVLSLAAAASFTGCELSGEYRDDNLTVQFGDTNRTAQADGE